MACECNQLERAFRAARAMATMIECDCEGHRLSIHVRLARAHALGACDELLRALEDHRQGGRCEDLEDVSAPPDSMNVPRAPEQETSGRSLGAT